MAFLTVRMNNTTSAALKHFVPVVHISSWQTIPFILSFPVKAIVFIVEVEIFSLCSVII
jgi:hypothetical protein